MEVDMLGSAIEAFQNMASLERLGFLSFGVLIGLVLGVMDVARRAGIDRREAVDNRHCPRARAGARTGTGACACVCCRDRAMIIARLEISEESLPLAVAIARRFASVASTLQPD